MIYDPAVGKTRQQRAFGELAKGVPTGSSRAKQFYGLRVSNQRIFSGPRNSVGIYSVADAASDVIRGRRAKK
jgi:hypothetical protein